jgi:Ca2+-dependent lipid-binding protein
MLIPIRSMDDTIKITCYDEDVIMDSCVGHQTYSVSTIANTEETIDSWFPLFY